jgi:hypothetical protein
MIRAIDLRGMKEGASGCGPEALMCCASPPEMFWLTPMLSLMAC